MPPELIAPLFRQGMAIRSYRGWVGARLRSPEMPAHSEGAAGKGQSGTPELAMAAARELAATWVSMSLTIVLQDEVQQEVDARMHVGVQRVERRLGLHGRSRSRHERMRGRATRQAELAARRHDDRSAAHEQTGGVRAGR